jgi:hypothetical protein
VVFSFLGVSVTFQVFFNGMLSKKIKIILNFLLLKKGSSAKFTHVNLAAQTAHFLVNYVFGQKIHFQKKKWGEGEK